MSAAGAAGAGAVALAIFLIHMAGDLWSPPLVGAIADVAPMRLAMLILPAAFFVAAKAWWVKPGAPSQAAFLLR